MTKILIIQSFFKPGYRAGGPIQSIYNLCTLLSNDFEIYVLTQNRDLNSSEAYDLKCNEWIDFDGFKVMYVPKEGYHQELFIKIRDQIDPNYIYFNSLFSSITIKYILKSMINNSSVITIIAPRGELDKGALSIKSRKKKVFLSVFKRILPSNIIFHATTEEEKQNIEKVFKNNSVVAQNVPKIIENKPLRAKKQSFQTNLVFISRISPKKNLLYAVKVLKGIRLKGTINFDVIGPIEDKSYWEKIQEEIIDLPTNIDFRYLGEVRNQELLKKTSDYHYLFFPTLAENYGHIIYESLSYGMPVILSESTPWKQSNNGVFVCQLDNIKSFQEVIVRLHSLNEDEYRVISNQAYYYAKDSVNTEKLLLKYKNLFCENSK